MALWKPIAQANGFDASYWRIIQLNLDWANRRGRIVLAGYKDRQARLDRPVQGIMTTEPYTIDTQTFESLFAADSPAGQNDALEESGFSRAMAYEMVKDIMPQFSDAEDYYEAHSVFTASVSGLTVDISDSSESRNGEITRYAFDFGDGQSEEVDATGEGYTAGDENLSHTYAQEGTYTVTLTVTDSLGYVHSSTQDVVVTEAEATLTATATDLTVDITDASSSVNGEITSWAYDFGDGNVATVDASAADYAAGDENVSHTYAAAGTYTVTLTVTDSAGKTDTATTEVVAEEAAV
jgi:hypothetical protein